jgi:predicted nucleic-acid-binding protein
MRAVDTNILIRFITKDDPKQFAEVERLFEGCAQKQEQVFVSIPVTCELVWVLSSGYRQPKREIVSVLEFLLNDGLFHLDQAPLIQIALDRFRHGKADFTDYLVGAMAADAGCRDTLSFDRGLRDDPDFTILPS